MTKRMRPRLRDDRYVFDWWYNVCALIALGAVLGVVVLCHWLRGSIWTW
jgi:hypothetical protein